MTDDELAAELRDMSAGQDNPYWTDALHAAADRIERLKEFETKLTRLIGERDELLRKNEALRRGNDQYEVMCKFYRETGVGIGTCKEVVAELRELAEGKFANGYQSSAYLRAAELAEEKLKPASVNP